MPAGTRAQSLPDAASFAVERGVVLLVRSQPRGRRLVLTVAGPEAVLAPPGEHEELVALTDAALAPADAPDTSALVATILDRQESLAILAIPRHSERVRAKLLQLARAHGRVLRGGVSIPLPLTHDLIADMTGSARETVTLALRDLADEGFLRRDGRSFVVLIPPAQL